MNRLGWTLALVCLASCVTGPEVSRAAPVVHALRLKPGADLKAEVLRYAREHELKAAWVSTCAGSLTHYALRFANQPQASQGDGHFEIVSLSGVVSIHGTHLHMSVADETGKTIGGHLMDGSKVYTTVELVMLESPSQAFRRETDPTFGYDELKVMDAP